jgi:hypothetical protein
MFMQVFCCWGGEVQILEADECRNQEVVERHSRYRGGGQFKVLKRHERKKLWRARGEV